MYSYEAWVSNKRNEIKRKFESTCVACGEETVHEDMCSSCNLYQPGRKFNSEYTGFTFKDTIEFPTGRFWEGDGEESALEKMKKADPRIYFAYSQQVMSQKVHPDNQRVNEMARKRGLFNKKKQ